MSPTAHLAAINLFTGDIQGGLGPFLATWLAQVAHWGPGSIGSVSTVVGFATLALNGPAGALVDRSGRPRLLLGLACGAILAATALLLVSHAYVAVLLTQFLAACGGILVYPALTALTLGIVGKQAFAHQQGQNQAFNHAGIVAAALLIAGGARVLGANAGFAVFGAMAAAAIAAVATTPPRSWNGRRCHGWNEDEPDSADHSHGVRAVLTNRRLLAVALSLALFNLGNGAMLSVVAQRLVATGADATRWLAIYVVVAQMTMIPVALWAGSLADRRGRRHLVLLAGLALTARAVLSAAVAGPAWLIAAEVLDGVASGVLGVAVPVLVADLTWGSGRTQTAIGAVNTMQGVGGALSGLFGGAVVGWFGWSGGLLAMAVPAAASVAVAVWVEETRTLDTPYQARTT